MFSFHKYFVGRDIIENLIFLFNFDALINSDGSYDPKIKVATYTYIYVHICIYIPKNSYVENR
jgi:hypothetical protein